MKTKLFSILSILLIMLVGSAKADEIKAEDVKMNAGTQKVVEVNLVQASEIYAGFQFDVEFPTGVMLVSETLVTAQTGDMTLVKKTQSDGSVRFIVYSPTLSVVHAGRILELQLKADKKTVADLYELKLKNIIVTDTDGRTTKLDDATASITVVPPVKVTVNSQERFYGDENDSFEYEMTENYTTGTPVVSCLATKTSPVGTYAITVEKGSIAADSVTLIDGTLTIAKAPLTINAGNYTMKQGEDLPTFKATYSGFKNGETSAVLTKQPTLTTTATSSSTPGTYEVIVSGAETKNYDITYKNGTLTILEADAVVVTAKSYTREYGEENPTFEFTSEGATLEGQPEITCEATTTSPVGTYPIVIKKGGVTNYNDSYVNGTLTITKAPLKVTVADATREQGVENPEFVITYEGWKNGETEAVLTKKPVATTTATKDSEVGEYDIIVSGGEAQNYELSFVNGKLTVTVPSGIREIISGGSFDVYTTDGRMVKKGATTLKGLAKGVYIVNGRKVMVK